MAYSTLRRHVGRSLRHPARRTIGAAARSRFVPRRKVAWVVSDFSQDRETPTKIAEEIQADLRVLMDGAAKLSEFTVDFPLQARAPLTKEQWAIAIALNTVADLLDRRADEACKAREP